MAIEVRVGRDGKKSFRVKYPGAGGEQLSRTFNPHAYGSVPDARRAAQHFDAQWKQDKVEGKTTNYSLGDKLVDELAQMWFLEWKRGKPQKTINDRVEIYRFYVQGLRRNIGVPDDDGHPEAWLQSEHELASKRLKDVNPQVIREWRDELTTEGCGQERLRKAMAMLQQIFDFACGEGWHTNPVRNTAKPGQTSRHQRKAKIPKLEQVERMRARTLDAGDDETAIIIELIGHEGLRPGEILGGLEIDRIHLDAAEPYLEVDQRVSGVELLDGTKSGNWAWRSVDLTPPTVASIRKFLMKTGRRTGYLIGGETYWTEQDYRTWRRYTYKKLAQIELDDAADDPYKLRHLCASLTYRATRDINVVAEKLGHSAAVCLETYQHVVRELRGVEPG